MLDWALWYASQGLYVFPCHTPIFNDTGVCTGCTCEAYKRSESYRQKLISDGRGDDFDPSFRCAQPGKCPRVKWRTESTTDPTTIRRWWRRWPDANIGCDYGKSGILVVDVDAAERIFAGGLP
jgi:hypothetical protein